jgi:hypothetical protein
MRHVTLLRLSMVAGAALFVAACGGHSGETANTTAGNELDSNLMMDETGNDASAMESVANVPEPAAAPEATNEAPAADTGGGSAEGDQVDSNVAGM